MFVNNEDRILEKDKPSTLSASKLKLAHYEQTYKFLLAACQSTLQHMSWV